MTRTCCHEEQVNDPNMQDDTEWTWTTTNGVGEVNNTAPDLMFIALWTGAVEAKQERPIAAGALYSYEIVVDAHTASANIFNVTCGGVTLWDKADGAGVFTGQFYALNTTPFGLTSAVGTSSATISKMSVVKNGMGKGA